MPPLKSGTCWCNHWGWHFQVLIPKGRTEGRACVFVAVCRGFFLKRGRRVRVIRSCWVTTFPLANRRVSWPSLCGCQGCERPCPSQRCLTRDEKGSELWVAKQNCASRRAFRSEYSARWVRGMGTISWRQLEQHHIWMKKMLYSEPGQYSYVFLVSPVFSALSYSWPSLLPSLPPIPFLPFPRLPGQNGPVDVRRADG